MIRSTILSTPHSGNNQRSCTRTASQYVAVLLKFNLRFATLLSYHSIFLWFMQYVNSILSSWLSSIFSRFFYIIEKQKLVSQFKKVKQGLPRPTSSVLLQPITRNHAKCLKRLKFGYKVWLTNVCIWERREVSKKSLAQWLGRKAFLIEQYLPSKPSTFALCNHQLNKILL